MNFPVVIVAKEPFGKLRARPERSVGINSTTKQFGERSEIASLGSEVGIKREEFREPHRSQ